VPHVLLHDSALPDDDAQPHTVGATRRDDGDLWVVDGTGPQAALILPVGASPGPSPPSLVITRGAHGQPPQATLHGTRTKMSVIPRDLDLFDRVRGVFETDVLRDRTVAIIGCGSGGSFIAAELAKAGVGHFILVDHDRLEPGNVCRHACGLSDVGRKKVFAVRDLILDRNPSADVAAHALRVEGTSQQRLKDAIATADLVFGATDNRESRLLLNRICLLSGQSLLFGAVFRRAYGGQVLRVLPGVTPCYQCFLQALPKLGNDQEIASADSAAAIAYSDRPVAIEPGLSTDVIPVALMMVKLAIVDLLGGEKTTLAPLREDLVAPLFLWLNRREPGTDYASLPPLENRVDDMTILRWYGVLLPRDRSCAACGDFASTLLSQRGVSPADIDPQFFGAPADASAPDMRSQPGDPDPHEERS